MRNALVTTTPQYNHTQMPVVTVSTLGGGDIAIPFPNGIPLTTGDLVRELATRVPNHRSTFLLCVNDAESPVEGDAPDADLTEVVDTTKDVALLYRQPYEAFATGDELKAAVGEWNAGGDRKTGVSERFGRRIGKWDVSHVTDMSSMFNNATKFNDDLSGWDTSKVTEMSDMFAGATAFDGDLSGWDMSSVTNMCYMFHSATAFNCDVSRWDTSSVTDMNHMFNGASVFNGDLSQWDVSSVTDMHRMFQNAPAFNGDISNWDTSRDTDMWNMFGDTY
jgi:surface protein